MTTDTAPGDGPTDQTPAAVTLPEGTVPIPVWELTLWQAASYAADGDAYWRDTMPVVLNHYPSIDPDRYWSLTVSDHRRLVEAVGT